MAGGLSEIIAIRVRPGKSLFLALNIAGNDDDAAGSSILVPRTSRSPPPVPAAGPPPNLRPFHPRPPGKSPSPERSPFIEPRGERGLDSPLRPRANHPIISMMTRKTMARITVTVTEEQNEFLRRTRRGRGNRSGVVRAALDRLMREKMAEEARDHFLNHDAPIDPGLRRAGKRALKRVDSY